jgi:hypothetical protein
MPDNLFIEDVLVLIDYVVCAWSSLGATAKELFVPGDRDGGLFLPLPLRGWVGGSSSTESYFARSMSLHHWDGLTLFLGDGKISRVRSFLFSGPNHGVRSCPPNGYTRVHFKLKQTWLIHRLVATVFLPNPHASSRAQSKDGNKRNNAVTNLEG